jgi:hypothetical protein
MIKTGIYWRRKRKMSRSMYLRRKNKELSKKCV